MSARRAVAGTALAILTGAAIGATGGFLGNPGHGRSGRPIEPTAVSIRQLGRCLETLPHCHIEFKPDGTQEVVGAR